MPCSNPAPASTVRWASDSDRAATGGETEAQRPGSYRGAGSLPGCPVPVVRLWFAECFFISSIDLFSLLPPPPQERGGRLPVPGPAGSPAADLPGQAAHRPGDRAGEDEEDGGFAAGAQPGRGREDPTVSGSLDGGEVLGAAVGTGCFRSSRRLSLCGWKSGINPRLPAHLPAVTCPRGSSFCWNSGKKRSRRVKFLNPPAL